MRRTRRGTASAWRRCVIAAAWVLAAGLVESPCLPAGMVGAAAAAPEIMPIDQVRAGMKGKGRTVFHGAKVEQFDVEVLGVLRDVAPGRNVILARADSPELKGGGVIAGMSGSPVYLRGKLIGAIAYTWPFAKDGVCGITPIEEMLADAQPERAGGPAPWAGASVPVPPQMVPPAGEGGEAAGAGMSATLRRIQTPVMVCGWSARLLERVRPLMQQYGLVPVQSGAAGAAVQPAASSVAALEPGSAVGIRLVGGDMDMTAIGTVTYCDGDRLLAFGHPFLDGGDFSAPMTAAYVHAVVPSHYYSFKLAGGAQQVGAFERDRGTVVAGKRGAGCDTIPCKVTVKRKDAGRSHEYNYSLLRDRRLIGMLAGTALASSYEHTEPLAAQTMADVTMSLTLKGRKEPLVARELFFDDGSMDWNLLDLGASLRVLADNPLAAVEIEEARFVLELERGRRTAMIHSLRLANPTVKPGGEVNLTVALRPYQREELIEQQATLRLPEDIADGTDLSLIVCDAQAAEALKRRHSAGSQQAETLEQLIELVKQAERSNDAVLFIALPGAGLTYRGRALPELPASLLRVLGDSIQTGAGPAQSFLIQRLPTEWVLSGQQSLTLRVREEP